MIDVDTGKELPDHLKWARFSDIAWTKDGSGFYYNRYPEPPPGEQYQSAATNQMIYFHKLGTKQATTRSIYRRPDNPDWSFGVAPTDDGKYLVLAIARSTDPQNQVLVREASARRRRPWTELIGDFDNEFSFIGNDGTKFYFLTDLDAPTKRIVAMDIAKPGREQRHRDRAGRQGHARRREHPQRPADRAVPGRRAAARRAVRPRRASRSAK